MNQILIANTETGETTSCDNAVDLLSVGGTVRWAERDGTPHTAENSRVVKVVGKYTVGVKSLVSDDKSVYPEVRVLVYSETDKVLYLSGPGWTERAVGEVARVRDRFLPRT